jgi:hypothetical protein
MRTSFRTVVLLAAGFAPAAFAQAPATPPPALAPAVGARDAASSTVSTEVKPGGTDLRDANTTQMNRSPSSSPGRGYAPMNIRLQEGGIKMPKCAEESREGLACK